MTLVWAGHRTRGFDNITSLSDIFGMRWEMKVDSGEKSSSCRETFEVVYERAFPRLPGIAEKLLSRKRAGHTLQPTALVYESYLRLRGYWSRIENEQHFYSLSARTMRQVLVDSFRSRGKARRVSVRGCGRPAECPGDREAWHRTGSGIAADLGTVAGRGCPGGQGGLAALCGGIEPGGDRRTAASDGAGRAGGLCFRGAVDGGTATPDFGLAVRRFRLPTVSPKRRGCSGWTRSRVAAWRRHRRRAFRAQAVVRR